MRHDTFMNQILALDRVDSQHNVPTEPGPVIVLLQGGIKPGQHTARAA